MELKQKWILLSATAYSMTDENSGEVNDGVSLRYLASENLNPQQESDKSRGIKPVKGSLPSTDISKIKEVPGIYEFSLKMSVVQDKPQLKLKDISFVSPIQFK